MSEPTDADIAKARTLLLQASQKKGNELVALLGGPAVFRTINAIATALTAARTEERRRVWEQAKRLACHRIGAMTNIGISHTHYEQLVDDIKENFDIAVQPKGLDWLYGKCNLAEFEAATAIAAALESGEEGVDDDVLRRRREIMPDYDEKLKRWLS